MVFNYLKPWRDRDFNIQYYNGVLALILRANNLLTRYSK